MVTCWQVVACSVFALQAHEKNKIQENVVTLLVKTSTYKFDYVLSYSAICILVNFFKDQVHVQFAILESIGGHL